jgi:hypothetical protein
VSLEGDQADVGAERLGERDAGLPGFVERVVVRDGEHDGPSPIEASARGKSALTSRRGSLEQFQKRP